MHHAGRVMGRHNRAHWTRPPRAHHPAAATGPPRSGHEVRPVAPHGRWPASAHLANRPALRQAEAPLGRARHVGARARDGALGQPASGSKNPSLRAGFGAAIQGRTDKGSGSQPWIATSQALLAMTKGANAIALSSLGYRLADSRVGRILVGSDGRVRLGPEMLERRACVRRQLDWRMACLAGPAFSPLECTGVGSPHGAHHAGKRTGRTRVAGQDPGPCGLDRCAPAGSRRRSFTIYFVHSNCRFEEVLAVCWFNRPSSRRHQCPDQGAAVLWTRHDVVVNQPARRLGHFLIALGVHRA